MSKLMTTTQAFQAANDLLDGKLSELDAKHLLTSLARRGEVAAEIEGFKHALQAKSTLFEHNHRDLLDTCGTGGDRSQTFNVSTAAALVLASGDVRIAKHGNRSATSPSGSADVLEALGIHIDHPPVTSRQMLDRYGFCFLFAPLYLPGLATLRPLRQSLGGPSIFNILGPLLNPARVKRQVIGVNHEKLVGIFASVLVKDSERVYIVHGRDYSDNHRGYDEVSITGPTTAAFVFSGRITTTTFQPEDFGVRRARAEDLIGGDARANAALIESIVSGHEKGAKKDMVVANAAVGFMAAGTAASPREGASLARSCIDQGLTLQLVRKLQEFNRCF